MKYTLKEPKEWMGGGWYVVTVDDSNMYLMKDGSVLKFTGYDGDNSGFFSTYEEALMEKRKYEGQCMKKEDLKTGMVLEFVNGGRAMVIRSVYGDYFYYLFNGLNQQDNFSSLADDLSAEKSGYTVNRVLKYNDNLGYSMRHHKIEETTRDADVVIWERHSKDMTMADIEKALGHKVKIIK